MDDERGRRWSCLRTVLLPLLVMAWHAHTSPRSPWHVQNPLPWSTSLHGLGCVSQSRCLAVGDGGTIASVGAPQGAWSRERSGTDVAITSISCPTTRVCYTGGAGGAILVTDNGGTAWTRGGRAGTRAIRALACPGVTTCFAADGRHVLISHDAGRHWTRRTPAAGTWNAVACLNVRRCYAVGGPIVQIGDSGTDPSDGIAVTHNGGITWTVHDNSAGAPDRGEALGLASTCGHGICAAVGTSALGRYNPLDSNAGIIWYLGTGGVGMHVVDQPLRGVACADRSTCIAVGDHGTIVLAHPASNRYGAPRLDPLARTMVNLQAVACPTAAICFAVGDAGAVIRTQNGGLTWSLLTRSVAYQSLDSISCPPGACYAAGDWGVVLRSTGRDWTVVRVAGTDWLNALSCPTADACYAVGEASPDSFPPDPEVLRSADGGRTWTRLHTPLDGAAYRFWDISCPGVKVCYVIADSEGVGQLQVLITRDGGTTWRMYPLGGTDGVDRIACPTVRTCYATHNTNGGTGIMRTSNGGMTWMMTTGIPSSADLAGMTCVGARACYAVGSAEGRGSYAVYATILVMRDGRTWSSTAFPIWRAGNLEGIGCRTQLVCFAAGDRGTILQTRNGGLSWSYDGTLPAGAGLAAVACLPESTCYAVGANGLILERRR